MLQMLLLKPVHRIYHFTSVSIHHSENSTNINLEKQFQKTIFYQFTMHYQDIQKAPDYVHNIWTKSFVRHLISNLPHMKDASIQAHTKIKTSYSFDKSMILQLHVKMNPHASTSSMPSIVI